MYFEEIDGERQLDFVRKFDYIREAGTEGEQKAAASIQEELRSFGLESRLEEFPFEAFEIEEARFFITEPFEKEYVVTGYGKCGSTPEGGVEAPFLYAENGDDISLGYATGKIVMVNGPVRKDLYEKLAVTLTLTARSARWSSSGLVLRKKASWAARNMSAPMLLSFPPTSSI